MSPHPLRALLVDDERLARKYLRQLLAEHADVTVVGEAGSVADAAARAAELRPDVIFLDVQMPPASGFDLLPLLSPAPAIVFVTAHDQFALRAFAASAADYLLKPVVPERLALALHHARHGRIPPAAVSAPPTAVPTALGLDDTLILRDAGRLRRVRLGDIAAIVAEGSYTHVHLAAERTMFLPRSMSTWAQQLPAPPFLRADRSLFVNLARVTRLEVRSRDDGQLTLDAAGAPTLLLRRVALSQIRAALAG
ncbi:LytR/AlgR family response regulator transcription factor [Oleiharenicola sp. Vm1]|uniref:LytR/AlgR family response regulator transcription factor n=1 Tax=Oleiharenicola sp. Vm1 TaxID=3398393 RepID=UPI0039F57D11